MKTLTRSAAIILFLIVLVGCNSTSLTREYKNPDTVNFRANKVLVVGISPNKEIRRIYEKKMADALEKEGVRAVKSIDFFEKSFIDNNQSLEQLNEIENKLFESDFDAILFTKLTGQESRITLIDAYRNFEKNYQTFKDYYYGNQHLYFKGQEESYQVYTTETSLYCICPGKERELMWRGEIEIVDAHKVDKNINDYIKTLLKALENNHLLLVKK